MNAPMHAGRLIYALAYHFDWRQSQMMTEFSIDGGQADMVFITKSGYLTEIEVKVSASDWRADSAKKKWQKPRPHVARFFYAVPEALLPKQPSDLPEFAGILALREHGIGSLKEIRPAKRLRAQKVPESYRKTLIENCYWRYWNLQLRLMRNRINSQMAAQRDAA